MKSFAANALLAIAVISGVLGIFNYTIQRQLLNENYYTAALDQSGIYSTTQEIVSQNISSGLVTLQKGIVDQLTQPTTEAETESSIIDTIILTLLNTLIDSQTPRLVETILERVNFQQNLQQYAHEIIFQSVGWLRGDVEANELFARIPAPEQVQAFRQASLSQLLYRFSSNSIGQTELPFCTTAEDISANLELALSGRADEVSCTNNQIQPILDGIFSLPVTNELLGQAEASIQTSFDAFGITQIIDSVYEVVLTISELKQSAIQLKSFLELNERISYTLLVVSLASLGVGVVLKSANRLKLIIKSLFAIGATVLIISGIYYLIVAEIITYLLAIPDLTVFTSVLTANQNLALLASLNSIVAYLIQHVIDIALYAGIAITTISATLWIMHDLIVSPKVQQFVLNFFTNIKNTISNLYQSLKSKLSTPKSSKKK